MNSGHGESSWVAGLGCIVIAGLFLWGFFYVFNAIFPHRFESYAACGNCRSACGDLLFLIVLMFLFGDNK